MPRATWKAQDTRSLMDMFSTGTWSGLQQYSMPGGRRARKYSRKLPLEAYSTITYRGPGDDWREYNHQKMGGASKFKSRQERRNEGSVKENVKVKKLKTEIYLRVIRSSKSTSYVNIGEYMFFFKIRVNSLKIDDRFLPISFPLPVLSIIF